MKIYIQITRGEEVDTIRGTSVEFLPFNTGKSKGSSSILETVKGEIGKIIEMILKKNN